MLWAEGYFRGSRNRFEFSKATGSCAYRQLQADYEKYGPDVFSFKVLEEHRKERESNAGRIPGRN